MLNLLAVIQDVAPAAATQSNALLGAGLAIGIAVLGAGLGLGRIAGEASQAIARQPEAAADIKSFAQLLAFLLEGATIVGLLFALLFKLL